MTTHKKHVDKRFYEATYPDGSTKHLPSVTTVLDSVRVKGFLDKWEQEFIDNYRLDGYKNFMKEKADEGTLVHSLIELFLERKMKGDKTPIEWTDGISGYVWKKFLNFTNWFAERQPEIIWLEKPLVSLNYGYAGRSDALLKIDGKTYITDWKSSKAVKDSHKMQGSAYLKAWEEMSGTNIDGVIVLPLGLQTKKGFRECLITKDSKKDNVDYWFNYFTKTKELFDIAFAGLEPDEEFLVTSVIPS